METKKIILFLSIAIFAFIPQKNLYGMKKTGSLTVFAGPMFAGKTLNLIRTLTEEKLYGKRVLTFKHAFDTRKSKSKITSHNNLEMDAISIGNEQLKTFFNLAKNSNIEIVGIDEIQFFPEKMAELIFELADLGKDIIVAGLDFDFKKEYFPIMKILLSMDTKKRIEYKVVILRSKCAKCAGEAEFSQRIIDGQPAKRTDPVVLIGAQESYEPRCQKCHIIAE